MIRTELKQNVYLTGYYHFNYISGFCLAYDVFATAEQVSQHIPAEVDAQTIASSIMLLKVHISSMWSETSFKSFFECFVDKFGCSSPHTC